MPYQKAIRLNDTDGFFCYTVNMFNSLTGTVTAKFPGTLYIETHGIEWDLLVPDSTLDAVPPVGQTAKVYTWLLHRDDTMKLFGFASVKERALFLDLLKVDGVGAKGAVKILSNISGSQLISALDEGNVAALEKIPGVGKKTAAKMLLALKGKLTLDGEGLVRPQKTDAYSDVADSLSNMGYDRRDCAEVIDLLLVKLSEDSSFKAASHAEKEQILFRRALVELVR